MKNEKLKMKTTVAFFATQQNPEGVTIENWKLEWFNLNHST
jgi:hypothetical protein